MTMPVDDAHDRLPDRPLDRPLVGAGLAGLTAPAVRKLAAKGIVTIRDLIEQVPRRYVDLSRTKHIGDLKLGEEATIVGTVFKVDGKYVRSRKHMLVAKIGDGTGFIEVVWWNQPFRAKQIVEGAEVAVAGRFERKQGRLQVTGAFFVERIGGEGETVHTGRIIPVHPATEGVSVAMLRRAIHSALAAYGDDIDDPLPEDLLDRLDLASRGEAFRQIHFPVSLAAKNAGRRRLAFEELFVLSAGLAVRKRRIERDTPGIAMPRGEADVARFFESLPYEPTGAQRRAVTEIRADMASAVPMHRLLQGEVGSGKTVVAVAAAVAAAANGMQAALMAPTEVLAEQHYLSVTQMLRPIAGIALADDSPGQMSFDGPGFRVALLTGSVTGKQRDEAMQAARTGRAHLLIGTHALIQEGVEFAALGLAIVDEQHRFGVHQRLALRSKGPGGTQPDQLIMTATPIPRTLAMTLYGDLDVSTIDEMPPGRMPVRTVVAGPAERGRAEARIKVEVGEGRQAFIVCPLVEKSASLEAKAAETEYERIRHDVFPDLRVGLIHGRLKPADKEAVMRRVRSGDIDVLVATTVVEVGVDIPNASVMMIEDADRFGLSQLHQLRGRIGRGTHPSTCILLTSLDPGDEDREDARKRLDAMVATDDGFRLAEVDMAIRGEGQIFGRGTVDSDTGDGAPAQAGATDLRFASLLRDADLLVDARREAFDAVDADPDLRGHPLLLAEVRRRFADRLDWLFAG
ncbi:MAG TPA: ATP-dependent DNA helicase RecG [Actinomycetota bacterium]